MCHRQLLSLVVLAACSAERTAPEIRIPVEPTTPSPQRLAETLIVSSPVRSAGQQDGSAAQRVAYVSLPPKTLGPGETVVIANRHSGANVTPAIRMAGFDPIAIRASVGDTLDAVVSGPREAANHTQIAVPAMSTPRVVRTDPPPAAVGILVEASIAVIVSEPVDPATMTAGAIRLSRGAESVSGSSALDSSRTTLRFTPSSPLSPSTDYRIELAASVESISGVSLAQPTATGFTTAPAGSPIAVAALAGTWDVVDWRFTNVGAPGTGGSAQSEEVSQYSQRIRVVFTQASPTSLHWRWTDTYNLSTGPIDYLVVGSSTAGDGWILGRTEQSPWFDFSDPCDEGDLCPLQNYHDFQRHGDTLTITRHELTTYMDDFGRMWPAKETVTLRRVN